MNPNRNRDQMQRPIQGMTGTDQHILRLLYKSSLALRVGDIQYNLDWKYDVEVAETTMYRRLGALNYVGLILQVDENPIRYAISDLGTRWVNGELSDDTAAEIERGYDEYEY